MTEQALQRLRLASPADLIDAVPYLLGFHPSNSLVALALQGRGHEVIFTIRFDLPESDEGGEGAADVAHMLARNICAYLAHAEADEAVLVVYGASALAPDRLAHSLLVDEACRALRRAQIEVLDALYVGAGRWWSYVCDVPECCPIEGRPIPTDGCSTVAATATYAGLVALPNREAVEKILEPVGFPAAQAMAEALIRADEALATRISDESTLDAVRAETRTLLAAALDTEEVLSDTDAARLIVGLEDIVIRDECCEWAGTERAHPAQQLWVQLARRATPGYDVVPLALVGWFAWQVGDSALARIAVDRCLRSDPEYSLGRLLDEALDSAVNPATLVPKPSGRQPRSRKRRQ